MTVAAGYPASCRRSAPRGACRARAPTLRSHFPSAWTSATRSRLWPLAPSRGAGRPTSSTPRRLFRSSEEVHDMRPASVAIIAAVVVVFLAAGGYLIFGRGSGGGGEPVTVNVSVTRTRMQPPTVPGPQGGRGTPHGAAGRE